MSMGPRTLAVAVHGFGRGARDMQLWKSFLEREFDQVITPDLPAKYGSFEECVTELTAQIAAVNPENFDGVYFAGHSMGGLLLREYLQREKPENAKRLVCVGTPHYGSKLADIALLLPGAGMVLKPLRALKRSARKIVTVPELPALETGAVFSTCGTYWAGKLFLSKNADGMVEKSSAIPPDARAVAETGVSHVGMMFDCHTAELLCRFLKTGSF